MRRGEVWNVSLDPTSAREQAGKRPVVVVSADAFNKTTGCAVVLPVTTVGNFARNAGFAVSLMGAGVEVTGVVRCDQPRTIDVRSRGGKFWCRLPDEFVDEILAKVVTIFETENV